MIDPSFRAQQRIYKTINIKGEKNEQNTRG